MTSTSPVVYRRRRIVFFGGIGLLLVAVAAGAWLLIAQPWADAATGPTPAPTSTAPTPEATETRETAEPTTPPDETKTPEPTPTAPVACRAADIIVEAITDAETYPAGALPQLSISLTNSADTACTLDVGSATQAFTVTSGDDVWWRSTDCQENPSSMVVALEAGQKVASAAPVTWDRTRSDVSTCADENRPHAPGGGASYHVSVTIGGFEAASTTQILLY